MQRLFEGRHDAYGAVHGQSIKQELTLNCWKQHLFDEGSVGVYPLCPRVGQTTYPRMYGPPEEVESWSVKWGCIDIDEGYERGLLIAKNLHTALGYLGITAWIERTKGKGYHVWVFAESWVPAVDMQLALRAACQVVDYTPKEVNPKQTELEAGQLGNYVNVCYAKQWADQGKRVVLYSYAPEDGYYGLSAFLDNAEANLTPPAVIAEVAALYKRPPPPKPVHWSAPRGVGERSPKGVALKMIEEGPYPSVHTGRVDRSAALVRLANLLHDDHFTPAEALYWVQFFDGRPDMLKYIGRRDAEDRYREIVERAYS